KARRCPPTSTTAESWRDCSVALSIAGVITCSSSCCIRRPPPPWASSTCSWLDSGSGQFRLNSGSVIVFSPARDAPAVAEVGGAGALAGYHGRAERLFRRTARTERGAFVRLLDALQDQAADAFRLASDRCGGNGKSLFGIIAFVFLTQAQSAARNHADAAPVAVGNLKDFAQNLLCRLVSPLANRTGILVLDV